MDGIYYVIKHADGATYHPKGTGSVPHLFASKSKAQARLNSLSKYYYAEAKVVPVQLTEIKGTTT